MSYAQTIVKNLASSTKTYSFLPPHGRTLKATGQAGDTITYDGDLYTHVNQSPRIDAALKKAVKDGNLEIVVVKRQWRVVAKSASYTVVNDTDNYTHFTTRGATGAVVFTLPATIKAGQVWRFTNEADQDMTVTGTGASLDKLVAFNDLAADSVAFSTATQRIGGTFEVTVNDNATKYLVHVLSNANTVTIATN